MKFILIHGRAQQQRTADSIKDEWITALNQGLSGTGKAKISAADVIVPYYGNELAAVSAWLKSNPDELKRDLDQARYWEAIALELIDRSDQNAGDVPVVSYGIDQHAKRKSKPVANVVPPDELKRGLSNIGAFIDIVRFVDNRFPGISGSAIQKILGDVYAYIAHDKTRRDIDDIITASLSALPETTPITVIAHSLGTVVAYNVMRRTNRKFTGLITLGSPLGIAAISKRLDHPLERPDVGTWINLYDKHDIVALNPLHSKMFAMFDPDRIIDVPMTNHSSNRHDITHYLATSEAAKAVSELTKETGV